MQISLSWNSYHATLEGALEMSSICLRRPFQVPAQTCISGSALITENKKDLANESPSHEHLVSNNLARAATSADRLNIVKPMESVSGCVCSQCLRASILSVLKLTAYWLLLDISMYCLWEFTRGKVVKRSKSSTKQNICRLMADMTMSRLAVNTTRLPSFFPGPKIL